MSDLKPCPFCGGEARIQKSVVYWMLCFDCKATGPESQIENQAVKQWNTRAELNTELTTKETPRAIPERVHCGECVFWDRQSTSFGICRKSPPTYHPFEAKAHWACIDEKDWCGEGRRKE